MSNAALPKLLICDRGLLTGVLAYQERFIDRQQLAAACTAWASQPETPVPDFLVAQGWLTAAGRETLERRLSSSWSAATADISTGADLATGPYLNVPTDPTTRDHSHQIAAERPGETGQRRSTVLRPHAQGGLGRVSVARDERLGRQVALKEIRPDRRGDARLRQRLLAEAAITGRLEHPGIVPVDALEDGGGDPYYVMRFVEGEHPRRSNR